MEAIVKEACVENLFEAKNAQALGAGQIELCGRLDLDGLTPDLGLVKEALAELTIHIKVMVRPRGGDFVYSQIEIEEMITSIEQFKSIGVKEVVLGALTSHRDIDLATTSKLVNVASPMKVAFHKAIDLLNDPMEGVRRLTEIGGITSILTSGGKPTAKEGASVIKQMKDTAGDKIQIVAAGKITDQNLFEIDSALAADAYHGKLIVGSLS